MTASVLSLSLAGASPQARNDEALLQAWLTAAERHVPGAEDEWVAQLAPWRARDLNAALAAASRAIGPGLRERLRGAVTLHTDIAILYRRADGYGVASTGAASTLVGDGMQAGGMTGTMHWEFSRRLLRELASSFGPAEGTRTWFRATAALLQSWNEYTELVPHLGEAMRVFPSDPALQLIKGTMHEYFAESHIQSAFTKDAPAAWIGTAAAERKLALEWFERALAGDPTLHEARIRRANVLHRVGRNDEAVADAARALAVTLPDEHQYFALLIKGRALTVIGRLDEARDAFNRAAGLFPLAQTPRLGQSQVWLRLGHAAQARTLAALDVPAQLDPWMRYHQAHVPDAMARITAWRTEWAK